MNLLQQLGQMNQRERILAIAVGVTLLGVVGWLLQGYVAGSFERRNLEISRLESELKTHKRRVQLGQKAARTIAEFEQRSLPANPDVARSHYHDWLMREIGKAGMTDPTVKANASQRERDLYVMQSFTVTARGTLPQVVDLLHAFYSVDLLQRIKDLKLKPIKDSKQLDVNLTVEALSMENTGNQDLALQPSQRLMLPDRAAYQRLIVGRNLLGPANQPPRLAISGSKEANTNRAMELSARATDADPLDKMTYKLVESAASEARFDPASGRFRWTPRAPGKYEFAFEATDDGFPIKSSGPVKVVINVTDAPPPPPPEPPKLAFDHAKFTVLTAVLDIGGTAEIWLHVRPTGETLKLHAGDKFEIGSIKGTIAEIGDSGFVFESDGKQHRLEKGGVLEQAQVFTSIEKPAESPTGETAAQSPDDL